MTMEFDVIVIGAGPAGEVAAGGCAAGGLSTAIIEGELAGGECSYWACKPSKALLRPSGVYGTARRTPGVRPAVRGPLDTPAVFQFRDDIVHRLDDRGDVEWLKGAHVTLLRGHGRLLGPHRVAVFDSSGGRKELTARKAVIVAVGTRPFFPNIPGLHDAKPWTNREATNASKAPRRLLILGGGPVALEMAQAWSALGSESITVLERGSRLLMRYEPFVGSHLADAFTRSGIDVRLSTQLKQIRRGSSGEITATLDSGATLTADQLLVATGRVPATDDIGLESIGLKPGEPIAVDDTLRATAVPEGWLYAVGDANGRNLLTHMGKYQARILSEVIQGKPASAWADHTATPQVIFTEPQVASVGLTEATARQRGLAVRTVQIALEDVAGYALYGPSWKGIAKLVVDGDRNVIVGATFLGLEAGEMLHAATVAIVGEVSMERLKHAVASFPTPTEAWLLLLQQFEAGRG
jgi:dihydrolipoamide dehydrogenase